MDWKTLGLVGIVIVGILGSTFFIANYPQFGTIAYFAIVVVTVLTFVTATRSSLRAEKEKKVRASRAKISKFFASSKDIPQEYHEFTVPKRDGTPRTISAPSAALKAAQKRLLFMLDTSVGLPDYVSGFRRGKGLWDNARAHANKKVVVNIDVEDFFPSFTEAKVEKALKGMGLANETEIPELVRLTTYRGSLPQGAPTSPFIANFGFVPVDEAILALLKKYDGNVGYTRYADDITFSSDDSKIVNAIRIIEDGILPRFGFRAKKKKTCVYRDHTRQTVTGLVVNNKKPRISRERYMKLRSLVWKELCGKPAVPVGTLKGHLAFFRDVDRAGYAKLRKSFEKKADASAVKALFG